MVTMTGVFCPSPDGTWPQLTVELSKDGGPAIITSLVLMERSIWGLRAVLTKRRFSFPYFATSKLANAFVHFR